MWKLGVHLDSLCAAICFPALCFCVARGTLGIVAGLLEHRIPAAADWRTEHWRMRVGEPFVGVCS